MRRKNSNIKRLTLMSRYVLKNYAIVYTLNERATFVNISTMKPVLATQDMIHAARAVQHHWRVYIAVMMQATNGDQYFKIEDCTPSRACYQENMMDSLNAAHAELIASTRMADRVNVGWVAVPSGIELSEEQIAELLETQPCFDVFERGEIKTEKEREK